VSQAPGADVLAYVALGANLGDARAQVLAAIEALAGLPDSRVMRVSGLYRTAPFEAKGPDFVNAVVALQIRLSPTELLRQLQKLENAQGRLRPYVNAPRTLDLDILLYGEAHIDLPELQIPHPRMFERAFVLVPLAEIAPQRVSAGQLAAVQSQAVTRIA
jgi:2-amino-4-hydroxy-6-hydroxymethyldihydropteridine diphosphokinase